MILGEELISHAALKESGYYFEFGRRYDLVRSMIGMIESRTDSVSVTSTAAKHSARSRTKTRHFCGR